MLKKYLILFLGSCHSSLLDVSKEMMQISESQFLRMKRLNLAVFEFRSDFRDIFATEGAALSLLSVLYRPQSEKIVSIATALNDFLADPESDFSLWRPVTVSQSIVLDRMKFFDQKRVQVLNICDQVNAVEYIDLYPRDRLGINFYAKQWYSFIELGIQVDLMTKLAQDDIPTKLALRNLAYDRRRFQMEIRDSPKPFIAEMHMLALRIRDAVEDLGFEGSRELGDLVKDASWDTYGGPSDWNEGLMKLDELIRRYTRILQTRPSLNRKILDYVSQSYASLELVALRWMLYLNPSELCFFEAEKELFAKYMPRIQDRIGSSEFELLKALTSNDIDTIMEGVDRVFDLATTNPKEYL